MEKQQKIRRIRIDRENVKEWWLNTTTGSDNGILKFLNYLHVILYPHGTSSTTFIHTNNCLHKICISFLEGESTFSQYEKYLITSIRNRFIYIFIVSISFKTSCSYILSLFILLHSLCKLFMNIIPHFRILFESLDLKIIFNKKYFNGTHHVV